MLERSTLVETCRRESPEYVKLSLAADMSLGFRRGRFWRDARMTCVNLLLAYEDGCKANCSYCGLARERVAEERTFIHVAWPVRSMADIIERLNSTGVARRSCISMVTHARARDDTLSLARRLVAETPQPVSVLLAPSITDKSYLHQLEQAGVDKIGIAIDAATEELFDRHRGNEARGPHRWDTYWQRFGEAVEVFGSGRVGSHFIVGLGEREEDLVRCFQRVRDQGGVNHLFSFFPEAGSALEELRPPAMGQYRRVQLACHLIDAGLSTHDDFTFHPATGRILCFGVSDETLHQVIDSGEPFRTRGCKGCDGHVDCNRPFGNSYPGSGVRNYPFKPEAKDVEQIRWQLSGKTFEDAWSAGGKVLKKIVFAAPNMKHYSIDGYSNRGHSNFLAVSVTGQACQLHCDHCQAKLLKGMTPTLTPEALWNAALHVAHSGGEGLLASGGCTQEGIVPLVPFGEALARIKNELALKVAVHSKFVTRPLAEALAGAGLDAVMVDLPGDERIIQDVFHLKGMGFQNVEETLDLLEEFHLPAAPHLLLGFGETEADCEGLQKALGIVKGRWLQSLVIVFLMPLPGTPMPAPELIPYQEVDWLFRKVRGMFPDTPVHLGCARPPGEYQLRLERLALKHRFNGIAFPADETIELAKNRRYDMEFRECCCALTL